MRRIIKVKGAPSAVYVLHSNPFSTISAFLLVRFTQSITTGMHHIYSLPMGLLPVRIINKIIVYTSSIKDSSRSEGDETQMAIIKVDAFRCERCGHVWISRTFTKENPPVTCAKCKNPRWNRRPSAAEK